MEDPNILEFASMFAEQHDVRISFTIRGSSSGCDVHMGKGGFLETITIPKEKLETMNRDDISEVLCRLWIRLNSKDELDEWVRDRVIETIGKWAKKEEENANSNNDSQNTKPKTP